MPSGASPLHCPSQAVQPLRWMLGWVLLLALANPFCCDTLQAVRILGDAPAPLSDLGTVGRGFLPADDAGCPGHPPGHRAAGARVLHPDADGTAPFFLRGPLPAPWLVQVRAPAARVERARCEPGRLRVWLI